MIDMILHAKERSRHKSLTGTIVYTAFFCSTFSYAFLEPAHLPGKNQFWVNPVKHQLFCESGCCISPKPNWTKKWTSRSDSKNHKSLKENPSNLSSWELTYPLSHFWRWCSFPKVGYVSSLEGNLRCQSFNIVKNSQLGVSDAMRTYERKKHI